MFKAHSKPIKSEYGVGDESVFLKPSQHECATRVENYCPHHTSDVKITINIRHQMIHYAVLYSNSLQLGLILDSSSLFHMWNLKKISFKFYHTFTKDEYYVSDQRIASRFPAIFAFTIFWELSLLWGSISITPFE